MHINASTLLQLESHFGVLQVDMFTGQIHNENNDQIQYIKIYQIGDKDLLDFSM